jgi:hypothetical protein
MAIKCINPNCTALFEWDAGADEYYNPVTHEYHPVTAVDGDGEYHEVLEHHCSGCGVYVGAMCDGVMHDADPSWDSIDWCDSTTIEHYHRSGNYHK